MNLRKISEELPDLIIAQEFQQAETLLQGAYAQINNIDELDQICGLFVQLYCSWDPPNLAQAEQFAEERERIKPTAYNGLQTAMMLYYSANAPERVISKLRPTIERARNEQDSSTLYSALALIGQSYIDLGNEREASAILTEIEQMILSKSRVIGADATSFLEAAFEKNIERDTVHRIAALLVPFCQDAAFRERLNALLIT